MMAENPEYRDSLSWNNKENEQYLRDSIKSLREYGADDAENGAFASFLSSDAFQGSEAEAAKDIVAEKNRTLSNLREAADNIASCMEEIGTAFMERMPEKENAVISGDVLEEIRTELSRKAETYSESVSAMAGVAEYLNSALRTYGEFTIPEAEEAEDAFDELCGYRNGGNRSIIGKTQKRLEEFLSYAEDIYRKYDPDSMLDTLEGKIKGAESTAGGGNTANAPIVKESLDSVDNGYNDWLRVVFNIGVPDEAVSVSGISLD